MNNGRTPFGMALTFSIITFFISFLLFWIMPALTEGFWLALQEPESPLRLILPSLLLSLLVGFLIWLNLTLSEMVSSYGRMITELKMRIQALEEKLDTTKKD